MTSLEFSDGLVHIEEETHFARSLQDELRENFTLSGHVIVKRCCFRASDGSLKLFFNKLQLKRLRHTHLPELRKVNIDLVCVSTFDYVMTHK